MAFDRKEHLETLERETALGDHFRHSFADCVFRMGMLRRQWARTRKASGKNHYTDYFIQVLVTIGLPAIFGLLLALPAPLPEEASSEATEMSRAAEITLNAILAIIIVLVSYGLGASIVVVYRLREAYAPVLAVTEPESGTGEVMFTTVQRLGFASRADWDWVCGSKDKVMVLVFDQLPDLSPAGEIYRPKEIRIMEKRKHTSGAVYHPQQWLS